MDLCSLHNARHWPLQQQSAVHAITVHAVYTTHVVCFYICTPFTVQHSIAQPSAPACLLQQLLSELRETECLRCHAPIQLIIRTGIPAQQAQPQCSDVLTPKPVSQSSLSIRPQWLLNSVSSYSDAVTVKTTDKHIVS